MSPPHPPVAAPNLAASEQAEGVALPQPQGSEPTVPKKSPNHLEPGQGAGRSSHRPIEREAGGRERREWLENRSVLVSGGAILLGLCLLVIYCAQATGLREFSAALAFGSMVAIAAAVVGGLLGFLFGIPRRLQQDNVEVDAQTQRRAGAVVTPRALYGGNTNLEQISDWLTKILLGAGLTQAGAIAAFVEGIGHRSSVGLGGFPGGEEICIAAIVYFSISGFLIGYLSTRLYFGRALDNAERTHTLEEQLSQAQRQSRADAFALELMTRQLSGNDVDRPTQSDLNDAISAASSGIRNVIALRAQEIRQRTWRDIKPTMERTIPLFRAFIEHDPDNEMYHGQLGFALKDKATPDWEGAAKELTTAISLRGEADWHDYEASRAVCRINLDTNYKNNLTSAANETAAILGDLKKAVRDRGASSWVLSHVDVIAWANINPVSWAALQPYVGKSR